MKGGREAELNQREEKSTDKEDKENTNMTDECTQEVVYLQSINSDKHLPQSPFTGKLF